MGEIKNYEDSAAALGLSTRENIRLIVENLYRTRPMREVVLRPCLPQPWVHARPVLSFDEIDLGMRYPDAGEGDFAYVRAGVLSEEARDVAVTMEGEATLYRDGAALLKTQAGGAHETAILAVEPGVTELVARCKKKNGAFVLRLLTAVPFYPMMKARDYLCHLRTVFSRGEYRGEEGYEISHLYHAGETVETPEYVFPAAARVEKEIRFDRINASARFGCAVSEAARDGVLRLTNAETARVTVNGESVSAAGEITLRKGDRVVLTTENASAFHAAYAHDCLRAPGLETARESGVDWLLLALPDAPESFTVDLQTPYIANGERRFWRTADGSYVRAYLDTSFFGQWFYALMVGNYGLLKLYKDWDCAREGDYFLRNMRTMAAYYEYAKYEAAQFGDPTFLQRAMRLDNLDAIGTMGMNFVEYYRLTKDEKALHVIRELADALMNNIPRFPDGAFMRGTTMWADDTFMSCPFLVRLACLTGERKYFDELKTQIEGFHKRLFIEEESVYSHIFFVEPGEKNRVPWGRGNGWIMLALVEILTNLPKDEPDYVYFAERFRVFAAGVRALQAESGMWRQVLDKEEAYEETSCTAMYSLSFLTGIRLGLLPEEGYRQAAEKGIAALLRYSVDRQGNVLGVCRGSSCSMDYHYYLKLGTAFNDDHGTGIILWALSELLKTENT